MILKEFVLGPIENNDFLLIDEESKEAVLIDCTEYSDEIVNEIKNNNAKLKYILLTHGHFDHVLGVNEFREKFGCEVFMHKEDQKVLDTINNYTRTFNMPPVEAPKIDKYIDEKDTINFGKYEIKAIHTPGHTRGGVCYLVDGKLFSGDTIFKEAVGRTDLTGGCFGELKKSIEDKIFTLDENIKIYPGHGPSTTVAWEKANNRFL